MEIAETLNTFFTGAGDTNGQFSNAVNQETMSSNETTTGKPLLSLGKTNSIEVLEVMKKLRPNKATGHDLIPPKVIQQAAGVLCHHFRTLFDYILDQAKIPQQWKLAEISPAHKKECKPTKSNYRQLSILPSLSKVFERLPILTTFFTSLYLHIENSTDATLPYFAWLKIGKENWITKKLLD